MAITYTEHALLTGLDIHTIATWEVVDTAARLALVLTVNDKGKIAHQTDNNSIWFLADPVTPTWVDMSSAGAAAVTSIFSRAGDVIAVAGDYTAAEVTNVPAGNLAATDVQAALDELDTEKAPATHTHVLSQITDSGTAAAQDTGTGVGDIPVLEDIGGGTPGLPAVDGSQLTGVAGGGSAITVTDEGGAPLTTDVVSFDFVGAGVTASNIGDDVTITIAPGSAPIDTVFSRTGTVVATASDYDASQVDNDSTVTGAFVDDALNTLDTDKADTADTRFPTTDEKGALAGTGTPSGSNRYVVDDDSRMADIATALSTANAALPQLGSSTNNAIVRYDGATGDQQDSTVTLGDGPTATMSWTGGGITSINASIVESSTVQSQDALRTWKDHVQYEATDTTVVDVATRGIWWVKDDSPTTPHFKQGDGTDHNLLTPEGTNVLSTAEATDLVLKTDGAGGTTWAAETAGGSMTIEEEGTPVTGGPHDTMNFVGAGVTAADAGGGQVNVTIAPGAAPIDTVFGRTGTVVAVDDDYTAGQVANVPAGTIAATDVQAALNELDTDKAAVGHTQTYTTVDGVPTDTFLGRDTAGTGAAEALNPTDARALLNVQDGSVAAGTSGDAYATSHEADATAHLANEIVNTPSGDIVATTVQAAIDELDTDKSATDHTHTLVDITNAGTAAAEDVGTTIGDVAQYVNVGGNAGMPAVDGSLLTGIDTGTQITVIDESTELTTNLNQLTFTGTGVVATEPGVDGEITVTVTSGAPGVMDITDGTTTVNSADLLTFNATAFDVVDQGGNDALLNPIFGTSAGELAEGDHVHTTLSGIDSLASGVILGRDTAGVGLSEELTPAEARAVIDVSIDNIGAGTHSSLENAVPDAGDIFASLQTGQINALTTKGTPVSSDVITLEDSAAGFAKKKATLSTLPDNSTDVTLAGEDYLSIDGSQVITAAAVDLSGTNVTGDLPEASVAPGTNGLVLKTVGGVATWAVEAGGTTVLTGAVDPTTEGIDGDFYYNTVKRGFWYNDTAVWEEVGVVADDVTVEIDATNGLQFKGFPAASTNTSPRKTAGGAIEWVALGGSEVNNLETLCTGIGNDELFMGTAADTGSYINVPTGYALKFGGTAFVQANATDTYVVADDVLIGRVSGAGGVAEELTGAQATALLAEFAKDSTTQGVVPASAGGTTAFLRADGTWIAPAGSGDVSAAPTPLATEYARWTNATTIEGRTLAETQGDLSVVIGTDVQAWDTVLDGTTASYTVAEESKLAAIEDSADVTDATNVAAAGASIKSSGAGAPVSTPAAVGDIYVDTTNDESYIAAGTVSSADWKQATGASGADLDGLSDVTLTAPATDAILIKTAGNWVDGTINENSITNDAVTNAKLGTMLPNTVKVNATTGTTNPTDLSVDANTVVGRGAAGNIVAAQLETSQVADDAITLAKIDAHTGAVAGVLGYGVSGVPSEVSAASTVGHVLKSAGTAAAPVFGQIITDSITTASVTNAKLDDMLANTVKVRAAGTTGVPSDLSVAASQVIGRGAAGNIVAAQLETSQIADDAVTLGKMAGGTDGNLISYDTNGDPTTVNTGNAGEVLTSAGAGAVPSFQVPLPAPKGINVPDPVAETVWFFHTSKALTISTCRAIIQGGTSIPVTLASGTTLGTVIETHVNAQTASNTTTGANLTVADTTIAADRNVWLTFGTPVGTQTMIGIQLEFA